MKWFKALLSALFLASIMIVPSGCGDGKATKLDSKIEVEQPAGHKEAYQKAQDSAKGKKG